MSRATALVTLLLIAAAAGCDRGGGPAPVKVPRKFPVETAVAVPEKITYRIEAIGELQAEEWVQVAAEVEGVLGPVRFKEGDRADPQAVLVEVDPERYRLALERQEAALARARADLEEKGAALRKRLDLREREKGWVPEQDVIHFQAQVDQAKAAVAEARALRDIAARDLERARVRPPIEGAIERREVSTGQYVRPGAVIATIVRTRPVRLRFSVREEEASKIEPGAVASFTVPAFPGERFDAEVFFVARSADPRTRRIDILARHPNEDERLKPGFFARVAVETGGRGDAILLPEGAVFATEDGFVAWVVEDGRARRRLLEIGLQMNDGRIEVRRGIAPGDEVVVRGGGNLADGVEVVVPRTGDGGAAPPVKRT